MLRKILTAVAVTGALAASSAMAQNWGYPTSYYSTPVYSTSYYPSSALTRGNPCATYPAYNYGYGTSNGSSCYGGNCATNYGYGYNYPASNCVNGQCYQYGTTYPAYSYPAANYYQRGYVAPNYTTPRATVYPTGYNYNYGSYNSPFYP